MEMGSYFHGLHYRFSNDLEKHDSIMVVVDKLTKATHFIPVKSTHKIDDIAKIFMNDIFKLHGLPKSIISYRYANFTSNFWKGLLQQIWVQSSISSLFTILILMVIQKG